MSDNDSEQFAIYGREDVIEYIQTGGGGIPVTASRSRKYAHKVVALCIELGWDPAFIATAFHRLDDRLLLEYPPRLFIEDYFTALIRRLGSPSLQQLGLRPEVAALVEPLVEPLYGSSYTDHQVLDTAIYYLLKRYTPIAGPEATHLINPGKVDQWTPSPHGSTAVFNLSQPCTMTALSALVSAVLTLAADAERQYFFHATSWAGSLAIMEGVDRSQGRRCLDFGIYPGFYMSATALDCLEWGTKKNKLWSDETAILIFSVPIILPSPFSFKELKGSEWSSITAQSRECKGSREVSAIRAIDFLYGDMVSNPTAVERGTHAPATHRPAKKQFVSKTDAGDAFMGACLTGCVYFQKRA
jgi:hypothetical protein